MTILERRQREKEKRRNDAIETACRLFFEKGYDHVTFDEIAIEAELGKTTLFSYFKDEESIFFAVVNQGMKILKVLLSEEKLKTQNVDFGISYRLARHRFIMEFPSYYKNYDRFRSRYDTQFQNIQNSDALEAIELMKEFILNEISDINLGIKQGVYRSDVDPIIYVYLFLLIDGGYNNSEFICFMNEFGITPMQYLEKAYKMLSLSILKNEREESKS
jgi:TetR/AcrR family transcriptional regulator